MRKLLILLALAVVTAANLGCCGRCRNLFRRGSPCCGTTVAAPSMLAAPIPLSTPCAAPQPTQIIPQMVPQNIVAQPGCYCQQAPVCTQCDPCQTQCVPCDQGCVPCDSGCVDGSAGYVGQGNCGCESVAPGEYFGGYIEGSAPAVGGAVVPQGSGTYPGPAAGTQ